MSFIPKFITLKIFQKIDDEEQNFEDFEINSDSDAHKILSSEKLASYRVRLPNLETFPTPSFTTLEIGFARLSGHGRRLIKFNKPFDNIPYVLTTSFGVFALRIPWVNVEIRKFCLRVTSIRIPTPRVSQRMLYLPVMAFTMNVHRRGIEMLNIAGNTTMVYFALGE